VLLARFREISQNDEKAVASSQTAIFLMCVAKSALSAVLCYLFWIKKLRRCFPAMGVYMALRVASMPFADND
jgi:hypothetical protein